MRRINDRHCLKGVPVNLGATFGAMTIVAFRSAKVAELRTTSQSCARDFRGAKGDDTRWRSPVSVRNLKRVQLRIAELELDRDDFAS